MTLWPQEFEDLRVEAREMASAIADAYGAVAAEHDPTASLAKRVASRRALVDGTEVESPDGVDEVIAGVPCRTFAAKGASRGTYLHFHGGGLFLGSARMNDLGNARIAERLEVDVVSVDYRLAPEHPFPAGADDCFAVARWLIERDDEPLAVGGESAGGYFAALTLLRIRDELGAISRIRAANLVFGCYDLTGTPSCRGVRPSDVPDILDPDLRSFMAECYIPALELEAVHDPDVSPLYGALHELPPALFTVGSADHFLDDSLFMASRWQSYGSSAELAVYPDCIHGFNGFPMELANRANERIEVFLDTAFST